MVILFAALWGFAEGTLFFIVPDVLISFVALRWGRGVALRASLAAALGAAAGGLVMYLWAAHDAASARAALLAIPAIDANLVAVAGARFASGGYPQMAAGAFTGIPYKVYAVLAGETARWLPLFLALTPLIRLPRFLFAALIFPLLDRRTSAAVSRPLRYALVAAFWVIFYAWYFSPKQG